MATTTIPWSDGSGDNIYLTYSSASGDQTVTVSSDANTGAARMKTVTFSATGAESIVLTVNQAAGTQREYTASFHPTSYDTSDYSWRSTYTADIENGYENSDSTTYAKIEATRGYNAETWIYYQFDTSSIPIGATILSVSCTVKVSHNANNTYFPTRTVQMYSGTTPKGSATSFTTSATERTLSIGDWTRAELSEARVKMYIQRGTTGPNSTYYGRFYGATLTVKYMI